MELRSYRWLLFALAAFGFMADQATKYGVFNWLYQPDSRVGAREIIPGAFRFLVQFDPNHTPNCADCMLVKWNGPVPPMVNHGALFSLGGQFKADANKFFAIVSFLAAAGITIWGSRKSVKHDKLLCIALGLILGGTLGNFYDRSLFGGVRDFLYFYLIEWPVFNVADCCLVVGAGFLLLQAFFGKKPATETETITPAVQPTS